MYYLGYEIDVECVTHRATYELQDNGDIGSFIEDVDTEPEPLYYGIKLNGVYLDWVSCEDHTIDDVFYRIKQLKKESEAENEIIKQGGCTLCGAIPMTANCNNGGCDEK